MNDWFQKTTLWLRKHYRSMHLLKAEIAGLEEAKKTIYEDYPQINWRDPKPSNKNQPNDPTWRAVVRLQELDAKHIKSQIMLNELEGALELLAPDERRLFKRYIQEAQSLNQVARSHGLAPEQVQKRLAKAYGIMEIGLTLTKQFEKEEQTNE